MSESFASPDRVILPLGKIGAAVGMFETGRRLRNEARNYWRENYAYTVSVSESDPLYSDVHAWLLSIMPTEKHRTLLVSSKGGRREPFDEFEESVDPSSVGSNNLSIRFDDSAQRTVNIDGHRVTVWLSTPEAAVTGSPQNFGARDPKKIKLQSNSYEGQQAIIRVLNKIHSEKTVDRKPTLKMVGNWGDWQTRSDLPARTMDSVCMPDEQKTRILTDMERFLEAEPRYNKLSIPWHRGYMFHGPPGTGKTSIAKALGNHFGLDLWYIGLADLRTENSLMSLIGNVGSRSILLLEDIDTMKITQDASGDQDSGTITIGSLLNALDGVATPHGLITIMTTNHFDTLDPRLIRAGRMDVVEELGWPTYGTLRKMFEMFYPGHTAWRGADFDPDQEIKGVSPAQFAEIFKNNMDDPWAARDQANHKIDHAFV